MSFVLLDERAKLEIWVRGLRQKKALGGLRMCNEPHFIGLY